MNLNTIHNYLSIKIVSLSSLLKLHSSTSSRCNFSEETLTVATIKGFFESKPSRAIANNLKHKKKQIKHWRFLSMSFKALAFFADVKR